MRSRALLVAIALVVTACGGGTASQAPASSGAPASVAPPSLSTEPVTLTVMHWGNQGDAWWNQRIADFTKTHANVTIKQDIVPYGQYADKLGAYRQAGPAPDVMQVSGAAYFLGFKDMFAPLNGLVDLSAYNAIEGGCEDFDCSKTIYGVPWAAQGHPIYYNQAVLTAAGVTAVPKTWKEMDEACTKIKAAGKACIAAGPKDFGGITEFAALMNQVATLEQCEGLFTGTSKATDPWFVNVFALWEDMIKRGWFQEGVSDANLAPEAQDLFTGGGSGFYTGLMGDAYDWKHLGEVLKDDLGVFLGPQIEQDFPLQGVGPGPLSTSLNASGGTVYAISKDTKAPGEALAFLKFMTGPETATATTDAGSYPAFKDFDSASIGNKALDQIVAMAGESKGACSQYLDSAGVDPIIAQIQLLFAGQTTPQKAAEATEKALAAVRQ